MMRATGTQMKLYGTTNNQCRTKTDGMRAAGLQKNRTNAYRTNWNNYGIRTLKFFCASLFHPNPNFVHRGEAMYLIAGVVCLSFATLLFRITYLGARSPKQPRWAGNFWVSNVHAPGIVGTFVFGILLILQPLISMEIGSISFQEIGLAIGIVAATVAAFRLLQSKKALIG